MMNAKIVYREKLPAVAAYYRLFETTGWNLSYRAGPDALCEAISASWYTLSAYDNDDLVGFGRVISDGVLYALICDLIVKPSYQGQGIGSRCALSGCFQPKAKAPSTKISVLPSDLPMRRACKC
jgi:ribosomal protein S18 acetylase RimI-like enzyme